MHKGRAFSMRGSPIHPQPTWWCELADPGPEAAAQVGGTPDLGTVTPYQLTEVTGVLRKARGIEVVELDLQHKADRGNGVPSQGCVHAAGTVTATPMV
jgi:hypothetical protein